MSQPFGKELSEVTEYDICEFIAENNFGNPIIQDALNKIALAEKELQNAKDRLIATVRLIEHDQIVETRATIDREIERKAKAEQAMAELKRKSDERLRVMSKRPLYPSSSKVYTLKDTYDNQTYSTTILPFGGNEPDRDTKESLFDMIFRRKSR